jgi:hypothetical protein
MAVGNKFNQFVQDVNNKVHNLGSDVLKVLLTNTAPTSANAVLADLTEIGAGNGYTAGGATVTVSTSTQTGGVYKLVGSAASPTWTAAGAVGPFRYVVLYNTTPASPLKPLICYWDYGSNLTLASSDTFTVVFDATIGILQDS